MSFLKNALIYTLVPFVYGYGYVTEYFKVKSDFKRIKHIADNHFKPFHIETNQIFGTVKTKEEFLEVFLKFKQKYPEKDLSILKLKISKYDFNVHTGKPTDDSYLLSFGLRGEHIHDIDYTLEDYFLS